MADLQLILGILFAIFSTTLGDYCTRRRYSLLYDYDRTIYCAYGCCGAAYHEYCCLSDTGVIIGIVIGGVAFVVCIGTVIFCCVRSRGNRPRAVPTAPNAPAPGVAYYQTGYPVATVTTGTGAPQPPYPQWGYPPVPQATDYNKNGAFNSGPPANPAQPPQPPAYSN